MTVEATAISSTSAALNAAVQPVLADAGAYFEYGTTTAYGAASPGGGEIPVGAGQSYQAISRVLSGLTPGTTYHYRVVATSAGGIGVGEDMTFTTAPGAPPPSAI